MAVVSPRAGRFSDIPLGRLTSTASKTTNPFLDKSTHSLENPFLVDDDASALGSTTQALVSSALFIPAIILQIQALGKNPCSFPLPPKTPTIPIFSPETGRPVYLSIREKRSSGNSRLVLSENETKITIATTTYWFAPGRPPVVRIFSNTEPGEEEDGFVLRGKSLISRTVRFDSRRYGIFEWRYVGKKERAAVGMADANNLLVLEKVGPERRIRVAQLVRGDGTRTAGTRRSFTGNGVKLEICSDGRNGGAVVDEVLVVATCLVMLKKEIDRM